jgi:glucuronate isomerase
MPKPILAPDNTVLPEDRFFDPDPTVRRTAMDLFDGTRDLPIISPHGHVDAAILADDSPFPEPTALIVLPDHYVFRMLYSQGIALESLGIPTRDGTPVERDPRKIWRLFAENYHLFRGTPTAAWLSYEFYQVFGVRKRFTVTTADAVYDEICEKLESPEFRPRALFERFGIDLLSTTDAASDTLDNHVRIRESGWPGRVIPTFRPDAAFQVAAPDWLAEIDRLSALRTRPITDYSTFIEVLEDRRGYFRSLGATATDHAAEEPLTEHLPTEEADRLFQRGLRGEATPADQRRFQAHMLMEMARCSAEDGLVMQLHAGSLRDHNRPFHERFGPNTGADIPVATEYTRNLRELLCAYGNDPRFRMILFTLDEATYSRELAPLAGHYPALRLGPPWWFFDSIDGMMRYREWTTETAGIYNTAGFNDDTRAFCSIPARHDLARRIDANWLARLVTRHIVDLRDAREMARALAYDLVRDAYRLD